RSAAQGPGERISEAVPWMAAQRPDYRSGQAKGSQRCSTPPATRGSGPVDRERVASATCRWSRSGEPQARFCGRVRPPLVIALVIELVAVLQGRAAALAGVRSAR
ncbi:hypothetical protein P2C73_20975, partial [Xanthomonas perforans]|uniref:hypothetical protein n=5 Tax=Xanthomonas TaxID=338 RepID=UPI0019D182E5